MSRLYVLDWGSKGSHQTLRPGGPALLFSFIESVVGAALKKCAFSDRLISTCALCCTYAEPSNGHNIRARVSCYWGDTGGKASTFCYQSEEDHSASVTATQFRIYGNSKSKLWILLCDVRPNGLISDEGLLGNKKSHHSLLNKKLKKKVKLSL
jgi:hypothetical protein